MGSVKEYHILSLSGGKDSTALAFFIKENMPEIFEQMEMVFCDTECELPELYEYLNKCELFLEKPITRIKSLKSFEHIFAIYGCLPHPAKRWCTVEMKTKPFRKYIYDTFKQFGDGVVNLYIGIRADEAHRVKTSTSDDKLINSVFPFVDNSIGRNEVMKIITDSGIGLADFYKWKRRSGCYFCFFQNQNDWLLLYEQHPALYQKAMSFEHYDCNKIKKGYFGWNYYMSLKDMIKPSNIKKIRKKYGVIYSKKAEKLKNQQHNKLANMYSDFIVDDNEPENECLFCHL